LALNSQARFLGIIIMEKHGGILVFFIVFDSCQKHRLFSTVIKVNYN